MASSKKMGFFCGEEKLTVVELDKNTSVQVISASRGPKSDANSPFSSNLSGEIQITALLQKILQDYRIKDGDFYVSLPMKDVILRSFIIPSVNQGELPNVIKFEAKKYVPFDMQEVSFVYHTIPFVDNQVRRIQVIFFAVRKEVLARYERIFQQAKVKVLSCDPCQVSLAKALLYKKEIKPTDHLAFLYLDKNSGYICFIDEGIPQFIREFQINALGGSGQVDDSPESLNTKILNEVANSFDFYARQFGGDKIGQIVVSSYFERQDLYDALASELKVKVKSFSPLVTTIGTDQVNHMDAIYALGAGVDVPLNSLAAFNFLADKAPKSQVGNIFALIMNECKDVLFIFFICLFLLAGVHVFFQTGLQNTQKKYDQLAFGQGEFANASVDSIQTQTQKNTKKLSDYKNINIKSDAASILLRTASILPQGAWLKTLSIKYEWGGLKNAHVFLDMDGYVFKNVPNEQIAAVYGLVSGLKKDKILSGLMGSAKLGSLTRSKIDDRDVTSFSIHGF